MKIPTIFIVVISQQRRGYIRVSEVHRYLWKTAEKKVCNTIVKTAEEESTQIKKGSPSVYILSEI